jgi:hypothetical protein
MQIPKYSINFKPNVHNLTEALNLGCNESSDLIPLEERDDESPPCQDFRRMSGDDNGHLKAVCEKNNDVIYEDSSELLDDKPPFHQDCEQQEYDDERKLLNELKYEEDGTGEFEAKNKPSTSQKHHDEGNMLSISFSKKSNIVLVLTPLESFSL